MFSDHDCSLADVGGFIKIRCKGDLNYRCTHSDTYYKLYINNCETHLFSHLCPKDPGFYQVCGHNSCQETQVQQDGLMLCGSYICSSWVNYIKDYGWYVEHRGGVDSIKKFSCNGVLNCLNTDLDERICPANVTVCQYSGGFLDPLDICDGKCDCYLCEDESDCTQRESPFGIVCDNWFSKRIKWFPYWNTTYVPPAVICDGVKDCNNGEDERHCNITNRGTCHNSAKYLHGQKVVLTSNNSCTVPNNKYTVCSNFLDQLNCSATLSSPLTCKVGGYETTVTKYAVCQETALCDDELERECYTAEGGCRIHKHRFCDKHPDCVGRGDESSSVCTVLTNRSCARRYSLNSTRAVLPIPLDWVMDGVEDCLNGDDENSNLWKQCGSGWARRYFDPSSDCSDVFICSNNSKAYVEYPLLCDKASSCLEESSVCKVSRNKPNIWDKVTYRSSDYDLVIGSSLPGLHGLNRLVGGAKIVEFPALGDPFGVSSMTVTFPNTTLDLNKDCRHVYGEIYVFLSCLGQCKDVPCVLKPVKHDSCQSGIDRRVLTLSNDSYLTIVRQEKGDFVSDMFPCNNGFCVSHDKVCNLMDDCGDMSDEEGCVNHFRCNGSGELLPVTSRLDGKYDCADFSDECFKGKKIIGSLLLEVFAWGIGVFAVFLNFFILLRSLVGLKRQKCALKLLNKLMIMLISLGDLMVGAYLILISIENILTKDDYCAELFDWLSSQSCALLGVLSTVGSQLSLFSMTVLSLTRVFTVGRLINYLSLNILHVSLLFAIVLFVFTCSVVIAVLPLLAVAEDFFVNGLYYPDVPLFIGAPSKEAHINILRSYYPKLKVGNSLTWHIVVGLVRDMFTQDYGGVKFRKLHFFGNDGVCLFKYFVTETDPQRGYTWVVLVINFVCFTIITISYIVIYFKSVVSSRKITRKKEEIFSRRNRTVQRKISFIIITDFLCWVPFITICLLHFYEIVDASPWYSTFSIIILPINSVINPLLYDDTLSRIIQRWRESRTVQRVSEIIFSRDGGTGVRPDQFGGVSTIKSGVLSTSAL